MTFGILRANVGPTKMYEEGVRSNTLREIGSFYEHKINTTGLTYEENQLKEFVLKNKKDPADLEQIEIRSVANKIATWLSDKNNKMFVAKLEHGSQTPEIIRKNYEKYILFTLVKNNRVNSF